MKRREIMTILQFGIPVVALSLGVATTGMAGQEGMGKEIAHKDSIERGA